MSPLRPALVLLSILLAAPVAEAQELSPRVGLAAFITLPASKGAALYDSGWKLSFSIHVRREELIEGRVRMEVGEFPAGKGRLDPGATITVQRARTRLVGYDWLIPLGEKGPTGLDVILGIGGVHWFTDTRVTSLPNNPYPFSWSYSDSRMNLFTYERELYESQAEYMMKLAQLEAVIGTDPTAASGNTQHHEH